MNIFELQATRSRLIAIVLAMACWTLALPQNNRPPEIKLGVLLSLTGNVAEVGRECQRGIDLALEEMNRAGRFKGTRVSIIEIDDGSEAGAAVVGTQRLISQGAIGIVGGTVSTVVRAAVPMAQRAKIPFVVVLSYTPNLTAIGDMVFQVSEPTSPFNKREVALIAQRRKPTKAALLWAQDNPTTVDFRDDFIAALDQARIAVVVDEPMRSLDSDFTAQLRKAMSAGADLLIPNFSAPQNAAVIKQAHSLGYRPITLGHVGDLSASFTSVGGREVIGHIANTPFYPGGSSKPLQAFAAAFAVRYGMPASTPAAMGYQAMRLTGEAIGRMLDKGSNATAQNLQLSLRALGPQPVYSAAPEQHPSSTVFSRTTASP